MTTLLMQDMAPTDPERLNPEARHEPWVRRQERDTPKPSAEYLAVRWRELVKKEVGR